MVVEKYFFLIFASFFSMKCHLFFFLDFRSGSADFERQRGPGEERRGRPDDRLRPARAAPIRGRLRRRRRRAQQPRAGAPLPRRPTGRGLLAGYARSLLRVFLFSFSITTE